MGYPVQELLHAKRKVLPGVDALHLTIHALHLPVHGLPLPGDNSFQFTSNNRK